jgi:hypothetical protein
MTDDDEWRQRLQQHLDQATARRAHAADTRRRLNARRSAGKRIRHAQRLHTTTQAAAYAPPDGSEPGAWWI